MTWRAVAPTLQPESLPFGGAPDEEISRDCPHDSYRILAHGICLGPRQRTEARQGSFRDLLQAGRAEAFRPGDAVSALVLVSRIANGVRGYAESGPRMRHRVLGYCAEPAVEPARANPGEESR